MGAYVGGLWASGLSGLKLEQLARDMDSKRKLWSLVDPLFPPRRGFIGGKKIERRLRASLGKRTFYNLPTPFYAVATELDTLTRAIFHKGDVVSAILASLAIPGIVHPVLRDGIEYVDGGLCDPLPTTLLREIVGVDKVIAVNVLPKAVQLKRSGRHSDRGSLWHRINQQINYFAPGNLLDILRSTPMASQLRIVGRSARHADILIDAVSPEIHWHDYNNFETYIRVGREAAEEVLPELKNLLLPEPEQPPLNRAEPQPVLCI